MTLSIVDLRKRIEAARQAGEVEELAALATEFLDRIDKKRTSTWLTPIQEAWESEMGRGTFPHGKAGRFLLPLHQAEWAPEVIAERLAFYCRSLKAEGKLTYLSLPRFVELFAEYDPHAPAFDQ